MKNKTLLPNTREERRAMGRECRNDTPRVSQGNWNSAQRKFDALNLLLQTQHGRITKLLPIKWARMADSPFGYFRGAACVMAADLAGMPRSGMMAQICGDAHVRNIGAFAGTDGRLIFDINDFDETVRGPWEWDLKRMSASLVLAGRQAGNSDKQCRDAVLSFAANYRRSMRELNQMTVIDLARYQVFRHLAVSPVLNVLRKAERGTPIHNREKLTEVRKGKHRLRDQRPLQFHVSRETAHRVLGALHSYGESLLPERRHFFQQYSPLDVVFRVVGTGSVGVRDYVVLMFGSTLDDPIFLQIKEELPSAYREYVPKTGPEHQGRRVAEGARAMQVQSDIFLGWTTMAGRDYLVRQLRDHKAAIEDSDLKGNGLVQYAEVCGELLAKGHARSGDPCGIYGYLGNSDKFDRAMAHFGAAYADQTEKDHAELMRAIRSKRLQVTRSQ